MAVEVILPRVDMDMVQAKISKWHVKDGDTVKAGAALFEIETDKAAMEIEAPATGIVRDIRVAEGDSAPVGTAVAFIYGDGEAIVLPTHAVANAPDRPATAASVLAATGLQVAMPKPAAQDTRATPLARRLARQAGLSLIAISGSGPHGRIVAEDVRRMTATYGSLPLSPAQDDVTRHFAPGSYESIAVDGMRRTIAQRLSLSKQTVPHFYLSATFTLDRLLETREALNAAAPKDATRTPLWRLSINDFVVKALGLALQRVPLANVTWASDHILYHRGSDVGVAVAVEGGLFTPVLRAVEAKPLVALSQEMKALAAKARARKLLPAEYQGGTTAVSNLGMFGVEEFTAIINPPHATILAVGAGVEQFVPVKGQPVLRTQMRCTLSCDHRAVDGAVGAELLQAFRQLIEDPILMLA